MDIAPRVQSMRILPPVPDPEADEEAISAEAAQRSTLGVVRGGLESAEGLLIARYFMFSQVYFHETRLIYDIHLEDFLKLWLADRGGKFPTDPAEFMLLTDNEVMQAIAEAEQNSASPAHEPARRIMRREHFRTFYERDPEDVALYPDAAKAIFKAAKEEFVREHDSWCGETHVQKAAYILQDLLGVDLGYDFVLYKHGPFSFELRDELGDMFGDGLIRYEPQRPPYGPRITATDKADGIHAIYPKTIRRHLERIGFVAEKLDARGVVDLERLETALYVIREDPGAPQEKRARRLRELKPHVPEHAALSAIREVDEICGEAATLSLSLAGCRFERLSCRHARRSHAASR
jgi:uncharacterized protein YwgA